MKNLITNFLKAAELRDYSSMLKLKKMFGERYPKSTSILLEMEAQCLFEEFKQAFDQKDTRGMQEILNTFKKNYTYPKAMKTALEMERMYILIDCNS